MYNVAVFVKFSNKCQTAVTTLLWYGLITNIYHYCASYGYSRNILEPSILFMFFSINVFTWFRLTSFPTHPVKLTRTFVIQEIPKALLFALFNSELSILIFKFTPDSIHRKVHVASTQHTHTHTHIHTHIPRILSFITNRFTKIASHQYWITKTEIWTWTLNEERIMVIDSAILDIDGRFPSRMYKKDIWPFARSCPCVYGCWCCRCVCNLW